MSIARTAPAKFELQDLVRIELVLRFGEKTVDRFIVEPKGGEDGSLFTAGPTPLHYEVQGKGAAGQVTLAELAKWLTHFPEHQDSGMLLERLASDPARRLVVVASGRVAEALDPLVAPPDWRGQALTASPAALAQDLIDAFRVSPIEGQAATPAGETSLAHAFAGDVTFAPPLSLQVHDGAIYVDEQRRTVSLSVKSLKQGCMLSVDKFVLTRPAGMTGRGIEIEVEITLHEAEPVHQKLAVTFVEIEAAESDD